MIAAFDTSLSRKWNSLDKADDVSVLGCIYEEKHRSLNRVENEVIAVTYSRTKAIQIPGAQDEKSASNSPCVLQSSF